MPVAEAPRSDLRHLRERNRHVQLREPAARSRTSARSSRPSRRPATSSGRSSPSPAPWTRYCRSIITRAPTRARLRPSRSDGTIAAGGNGDDKHQPAYRLYEVQNGNHIETYQDTFAQLELIQPHAQRAFDLLVGQVERGAALPPNQCIPARRRDLAAPAQPGHCAKLFVP